MWICKKQHSVTNPRASVCEYQCLTFLSVALSTTCRAGLSKAVSNDGCTSQQLLHISRHLKSLALRRQRTHHFLKPFPAGYPKKPLIATINLDPIHQVASTNLGFGDKIVHKHRDWIWNKPTDLKKKNQQNYPANCQKKQNQKPTCRSKSQTAIKSQQNRLNSWLSVWAKMRWAPTKRQR